jgi:vacuolar-type H+-ATPase subunit E/Vma4
VRAKEKAEEAAEKERQKAARDAQKAIQLFQKGKRKASQAHKPPTKCQTPSGAGAARAEAPSAVIAAPLQKTKTQSIQNPKKYSE